jgi:DNA ligase 1
MRAFSKLFDQLERATQASERIAAFEDYFRSVPASDAAWALWVLMGGRLKRLVAPERLRQWTAELADLPLWLVGECHAVVGDLGETLALLLPPNGTPRPPALATLMRERVLPLAGASEAVQRELVRQTWSELDGRQRQVWHRLITGTLRVGHAPWVMARALANLANLAPSVMAHRLDCEWHPTSEDFARLLSAETASEAVVRAYPFPTDPAGGVAAFPRGGLMEPLADSSLAGIRAQLIRRAGRTRYWTCEGNWIGGALVEIEDAARALPEGTVLDGVLVAGRGDRPLPLAELRRELNRRDQGGHSHRTAAIGFLAWDLWELRGGDWRGKPYGKRRQALEEIVAGLVQASGAVPRAAGAMQVQGELFAPHPATLGIECGLRLWDFSRDGC